MATLSSILKKIAIDLEEACSNSIGNSREAMLAENKTQLFDGKLKTGQDLSPSYLDDPYFKSPEAAKRYSEWKDRITPNENRKSGTPNLFINGAFYSSLSIEVHGSSISIDSSFPAASNIQSKFTNDIYGLGGKYKLEYMSESLVPAFNGVMKQIFQ